MYSQLLLVAACGEGMGPGGVVQYIAEFKNTDVFMCCIIKEVTGKSVHAF